MAQLPTSTASNMKDTRTDEELNRIIAEWMGWKFQPETPSGAPFDHEPEHWLDADGGPVNWFFCEDLNAIYNAENKLICDKLSCEYEDRLIESDIEGHYYWRLRHASARQCSEALVAVIESTKP